MENQNIMSKQLTMQEKRDYASKIIETLKGIQVSDARKIINFHCPLALKLVEEELSL